VEYLIVNLSSAEDARRAVDGVDTIDHVAAGMKGLPATIFLNTVIASQRILEAIKDTKPRVVLVSSIGVFNTSLRNAKHPVGKDTDLDPMRKNATSTFTPRFGRNACLKNMPSAAHRFGCDPSRGALRRRQSEPWLPVCHVANCAEAIVLAGTSPLASGHGYNVLDDNLPSAKEYLRLHEQAVQKVTSLRLPYPAVLLLARFIEC